MRIVGGLNKGRRIKISKRGIRTTKGKVREAIFNVIQNIKNLSLNSETKVMAKDFRIWLKKIACEKFDIIFLDPPYSKNYVGKTIKLISQHKLLKDKGIIVAEHHPEEKFILPEDLSILKTKRYGETAVTFINAN